MQATGGGPGHPDVETLRNWSSGQDQVATIKRQLQLMLPSVKVFLDVDDLDDVDFLELYIGQSQLVCFFLSDGFFYSPNCMREVRETFQREPPELVETPPGSGKLGGGAQGSLREKNRFVFSFSKFMKLRSII